MGEIVTTKLLSGPMRTNGDGYAQIVPQPIAVCHWSFQSVVRGKTHRRWPLRGQKERMSVAEPEFLIADQVDSDMGVPDWVALSAILFAHADAIDDLDARADALRWAQFVTALSALKK